MKARKRLRLENYDYATAGWYSLTICVRDRKAVLGCVVGADVLIGPQVQLSELGKVVDAVIATMPNVDKYVIMPDHVHMIVRIGTGEEGPMGTSAPTGSVQHIVRYFKRSVTRLYGENIWQRSYYDHIIRDESDYLDAWNYINGNPMKQNCGGS